MGDPIGDLDGSAAIPRKNGEPQFAAPWEGRAFGIAMVLHERGEFGWEDFRSRLIDAIGSAEPSEDRGSPYYAHWLAALTGVLAECELVGADELEQRAAEFRTGTRREVY